MRIVWHGNAKLRHSFFSLFFLARHLTTLSQKRYPVSFDVVDIPAYYPLFRKNKKEEEKKNESKFM